MMEALAPRPELAQRISKRGSQDLHEYDARRWGALNRLLQAAARGRAPLRALPAVALISLLALVASGQRAHGDGGERVIYDNGAVLLLAGSPFPLPLVIDFFTDREGPPAARWVDDAIPIDFCTFQNQRPATLTAEQFRDAVVDAAEVWNTQQAAVGVRYDGDCPGGFRWELDNVRNEIGFDDGRNLVSGNRAGVAIGSWRSFPNRVNTQRREFVEFDIVFDADQLASVPFVCFQSVVVHEIGHAIGFGHSDARSDLMFESFNPSNLESCRTAPSDAELVRLQELYGVDLPPTVDAGDDRIVDVDAAVTLTASGGDPEGGSLSFEWEQSSGPAVELSADGASVSFRGSSGTGQTLVFQVTAFDRYLHRVTDSVSVTVTAAYEPPKQSPGLLSFQAGTAGDAELGWTEVAGATRYEFCHQPPGIPLAAACSDLVEPFGPVSWELTLGSQGSSDATRLFRGGVRETSLRACNSQGCSRAGVGPLSGGLSWPAWEMDYDYFVWALDLGGTRFTIVGVVNVSGPPREFTLYSGPEDEPEQMRLRRCGSLSAGRHCVDFLGPEDDHFAVVTIVTTGSGTPTTKHRVTVR